MTRDRRLPTAPTGIGAAAILLVLSVLLAGPVGGEQPDVPGARNERHFLFYLHGQIVEGTDGRPRHPELGVYRFPEILARLGSRGFVVLSEIRPRGARVEEAAAELVAKIERLLEDGVPPERIGVVGHSKGGRIALEVARRLPGAGLSFGVLAGCFPGEESVGSVQGRFLSIVDEADRMAGSCSGVFSEAAAAASEVRELRPSTGRGHGLFYDPDDVWIDPVARWLRGEPIAPPSRESGQGWSHFRLDALPADDPVRSYRPFFREGALSGGLFRLSAGEQDHHKPHTENEIYVVLSGRAGFEVPGGTLDVGEGSVLFVRAGTEHGFGRIEEDLEVLLIFIPPAGP